ncbi:Druantia anti-phage system protein DruA, partial [Candidatus Igneacidithiobacillus taiwanensis]|uniref:Druantia anti-phage system protein DruA n=1 Tax=Candidatus Igneacidithiobacillus taiwanensis TaxID=1945924 RepID=UPI0028A23771
GTPRYPVIVRARGAQILYRSLNRLGHDFSDVIDFWHRSRGCQKLQEKVRYCGRDFTETDIEIIRQIIGSPAQYPTRQAISQAVCRELQWLRPDGRIKDMSCRVALIRMDKDGLISLPLPRYSFSPKPRPLIITSASDAPGTKIIGSAKDFPDLALRRAITKDELHLWREFVTRYHYLGYTKLPGAQIRYFIENGGQILGVIGFAASAWKTAPRDKFIGWTSEQRERNLHLIVNNARFLILPWVKVHNLASCVLGLAARQLPRDWQEIYSYSPVMLETFVESYRFLGTCYQAANWIYVGETKGTGKVRRPGRRRKCFKDVYLYPLNKNFRKILKGGA